MKFGLIGNGTIATRHKEAIKHVGGELAWISDPVFVDNHVHLKEPLTLYTKDPPSAYLYNQVDYVVICSPTYLHRQQVQEALRYCQGQIICEKPLCLPWEPLIDDDRINIVLQLRWLENLPQKADLVKAIMVRDEVFFKTWKGDPMKAGGNIYEFYIHYADLAIQLGADFEGQVLSEGKQVREITLFKEAGVTCKYDIMAADMQGCYNRMYEDIMKGNGVKPKDIFYLTWVLNQNSMKFGYRYAGINNKIFISKDLL